MSQDCHHYERMEKLSFRYDYYAFIDRPEYLADGLFIRHQVRVFFGPAFSRPGEPYRMITCKVKKRDLPRFLAALDELPNKMLLCGHTDYIDYCNALWDRLHRSAKEGREPCEEDDPAQKAEQAGAEGLS